MCARASAVSLFAPCSVGGYLNMCMCERRVQSSPYAGAKTLNGTCMYTHGQCMSLSLLVPPGHVQSYIVSFGVRTWLGVKLKWTFVF